MIYVFLSRIAKIRSLIDECGGCGITPPPLLWNDIPQTFIDLFASDYVVFNSYYQVFLPSSLIVDSSGVITDTQHIISCDGNEKCGMCWKCYGGSGTLWWDNRNYLSYNLDSMCLCYIQLLKCMQNGEYSKKLSGVFNIEGEIRMDNNKVFFKHKKEEFSLFDFPYKLSRCVDVNELVLIKDRIEGKTLSYHNFVSIAYNRGVNKIERDLLFRKYIINDNFEYSTSNNTLNKFYVWYITNKLNIKPPRQLLLITDPEYFYNKQEPVVLSVKSPDINLMFRHLCLTGSLNESTIFTKEEVEDMISNSKNVLELYWLDMLFTGGKLGEIKPLPLDDQLQLSIAKNVLKGHTNDALCGAITGAMKMKLYPSLDLFLNPNNLYEICENGLCSGSEITERSWNAVITTIKESESYKKIAKSKNQEYEKVGDIYIYGQDDMTDLYSVLAFSKHKNLIKLTISNSLIPIKHKFLTRGDITKAINSIITSENLGDQYISGLLGVVVDDSEIYGDDKVLLSGIIETFLENVDVPEPDTKITPEMIESTQPGVWSSLLMLLPTLVSSDMWVTIRELYDRNKSNITMPRITNIPKFAKVLIDTISGWTGMADILMALVCQIQVLSYVGKKDGKAKKY